ncbi:hypothetical protein LUZ63_017736 [Rhynchospora breviuscula]|uniref:Reverse transcriptase zinc-binding domain-containing protein n=1 Tax=Rhynchospora breviuscula TaxID=2022672 RepID=A0A9Q0C321_9POAL|nr:hypothetical protein LUZ63_017736 [Rhynchospora breviuscula]
MKWLWKLKCEPTSVWASTVQLLYGTTDINDLSNYRISYGLTDILQHGTLFNLSVIHANGNSPATWKLTANGIFSSASVYQLISNTGVLSKLHPFLWKMKSPPRVKIFLWLLLQDRLLTQQNLIVRGWPSSTSCSNCNGRFLETTGHLFLQCQYAISVWSLIQLRFKLPRLDFTLDIGDFWLSLRSFKDWNIIWVASSWNIWKTRNKRIFSNIDTTPYLLLKDICACVHSWKDHA